MLNREPNWQRMMQTLQAKIIGDDVKNQLCLCLIMCNESHAQNVDTEGDEYEAIIAWDGEHDPMPPGWILDPNDLIFKREVTQNG